MKEKYGPTDRPDNVHWCDNGSELLKERIITSSDTIVFRKKTLIKVDPENEMRDIESR